MKLDRIMIKGHANPNARWVQEQIANVGHRRKPHHSTIEYWDNRNPGIVRCR